MRNYCEGTSMIRSLYMYVREGWRPKDLERGTGGPLVVRLKYEHMWET